MQGTILRSDVYKAIQSGEPFDMQFVTCNRKKGTGGDLKTCDGWMILRRMQEELPDPAAVGGDEDLNEALVFSKDPNHLENGTVNVFNPAIPGDHPVKVHYDLITTFNGKRVIN